MKQRNQSDCGPTCLAYIARRFGRRVSVTQLRLAGGTNAQGTTALGLVAAARAAGFSARGYKAPLEKLSEAPRPVIAHCRLPNGLLHYVVVTALNPRQRLRIMDPAVGRQEWWTWERFEAVFTGVILVIAPDLDAGAPSAPAAAAPLANWRRLWELLRPHRALWVQAFVGAVFSTVLALATSLYVQNLMDRVIPDGDHRLLLCMSLGMLVVLGLRAALGVIQSRLALHTAQQIDGALMLGYHRRLLRLPQAFFDSMRTGEIMSRVNDAVKIREFLNGTLLNLVLQPLILVFALVAMFAYSWKLGLLAAALVPVQALLWLAASLANRRHLRGVMERSADLSAQLNESLQTQRCVRAFGLEEDTGLCTENRLVALLRTVRQAAMAALATGTGGMVATQLFTLVLLWLGTSLVLSTELTPGELFSCYTLAGYLTGPAVALIGLNAALQQALVATERLYEIMDLAAEADPGTVALQPRHATGVPLVLEQITFRHAGRLPVLQEFSAEFAAGRITALSGESGSGKSTILALAQRLHVPEKGRVRLGELDATLFTLASWRAGLGVVPQKVDLFRGTILENLTPGEATPDLERLVRLCRETGFMEFIERQPQGLLTPLTENGQNLSGGQRQKLAIVRALYRQPPLLLFDEPSSALDETAETQLAQVLRRERDRGATILLAAHSPRLLAIADEVVRLADQSVRTTASWTGAVDSSRPVETRLQPAPVLTRDTS